MKLRNLLASILILSILLPALGEETKNSDHNQEKKISCQCNEECKHGNSKSESQEGEKSYWEEFDEDFLD